MTWPTTAVSTTNLDAGADEPRLARADIKQAVDNVNAMAAEFGNVAISSSETYQVLQYNGTGYKNQYPQIKRFTEPVNAVSAMGNITVDLSQGNNWSITLTGDANIAIANVTAPALTSVIWIHQGENNYDVNFAVANVRYAGNVRTFSTATNVSDAIVATTLDSGTNWLVSLTKGYQA